MPRDTIRAQWSEVNQKITRTDASFARNNIAAVCGYSAAVAAAILAPPTDIALMVLTGSLLVSAAATFRALYKYQRLRMLKETAHSLSDKLRKASPRRKRPNESAQNG
jgi:hypothetical protein